MSKSDRLQIFWGLLAYSCLFVSGVAAREVPTVQTSLRPSEAAASAWFEKHRDRPPALRAFLQRMPKGGDIHSHLSGAVYAEHHLQGASEDGYCVDPSAIALIEPKACNQSNTYFPASELFNRTKIYDALVNRLRNEYLLVARGYNLDYKDLKRLARNSLEYSFLPGESLWKSDEFTTATATCSGDSLAGQAGVPTP